jgi:hypothetical protein
MKKGFLKREKSEDVHWIKRTCIRSKPVVEVVVQRQVLKCWLQEGECVGVGWLGRLYIDFLSCVSSSMHERCDLVWRSLGFVLQIDHKVGLEYSVCALNCESSVLGHAAEPSPHACVQSQVLYKLQLDMIDVRSVEMNHDNLARSR